MPDWKKEIRQRLADMRLAPPHEAQIVEELSQHLEDRYDEVLATGGTEVEASHAALSELKDSEFFVRELGRVERPVLHEPVVLGINPGRTVLSDLWQDLRYAVRMLRKNPGFAAVAVLSLALGIGVNTSIFTLFYSLALRPLPVKDPEGLVNVYQTFDGPVSRRLEGNIAYLSYPDYLSYRDQTHAFSGLVAYADATLTLSGDEGEKVNGLLVSDNYFSVLGAGTALGRTFAAGECQTAGQCPVAVLSNGFWRRRFGSDSTLIGKTLTINRRRLTVVGIGTPDVRGTGMTVPDIWIPLTMQPELMQGTDFLPLHDCSWLNVLGRLKPGVSPQQALAEMTVIAARADQEYLDRTQEYRDRKTVVTVVPGAYLNFPEARTRGIPIVGIVMGGVGLVLLIACFNVCNLLLARAATRRKEIVVRMALGANRRRLIRQLLTESLVLAVLGGTGALLLAFWLPPILLSVIPESGVDVNLRPNLTVLGYTLIVSLLTGIIFGLVPALEASRLNLASVLNATGRVVNSRSRLRSFLIVSQVAVSLVLLICAGLLARSLVQAKSADLGFDPKNVLVVSLDPASAGYDITTAATLYQQLMERLTLLHGVKSVSIASTVPFAGALHTVIELEDRGAKLAGRELPVNLNFVSPQYFQTLDIAIIRGRAFSVEEARGAQTVSVVSKTMAERFWPRQEAIGKRFKDGSATYEVIGVAQDVSSTTLPQPDGPFFYLPAQVDKQTGFTFLLRTDGNQQAVTIAARDAVRSIDTNLPASVRHLEENLDRKLRPVRTAAIFSGTLSILALLLATTGIYGVMAYFVTERTREIGIRMALGARASDVLKLIMGQGLLLISAGIAIGLAASFALMRLMKSLLFGVGVTDPLTFIAIPMLLALVALFACYFPARRSTKVDPLIALRSE